MIIDQNWRSLRDLVRAGYGQVNRGARLRLILFARDAELLHS